MLNKPRCGRPYKLSDRDARAIVRKVKKNPEISAPKSAVQIVTASGKKKRLDFAFAHVEKDFDFWKTVVFTDESKFNVFGSDGRGKVWRKEEKKTAMNPENSTPTVKHGGVKERLLYRTPKQLHSPPQSPDFNPIEDLWEEVDRRVLQQAGRP
ncbi:transposable element Tcb1 transposase [Trichonephila clavipes]|nr:transposable element Tcb1 transposase [Trichonephila clavipes]